MGYNMPKEYAGYIQRVQYPLYVECGNQDCIAKEMLTSSTDARAFHELNVKGWDRKPSHEVEPWMMDGDVDLKWYCPKCKESHGYW